MLQSFPLRRPFGKILCIYRSVVFLKNYSTKTMNNFACVPSRKVDIYNNQRRSMTSENMQSPSDQIILSGMVFHAKHGVYKAERVFGQKFIVSLELTADLSVQDSQSDLSCTVDYERLYKCVRKCVEEDQPVPLIEGLAHRIVSVVFREFMRVLVVNVEVRKPHAPLPGPLDYAGVRVRRRREEWNDQWE
eukprot:290140_1